MQSNDSKPIVSICCLSYNHAPYIRQCLDGFMMQKTTFPFEVLIHDDASTDGTQAIIREYESKYPDIVKPIYQKENQYSKGIKVSAVYQYPRVRGKYVAMCEGDDFWIDSLKLQKQVDFLENNLDYVLVYTGAYKVNYKSELVVRNSLRGFSGNMTDYFFKKGNPIITPTTCFCSKYLFDYEKDMKENSLKMRMGDLPFWLFMSRLGKFKYLEEKTTSYRILQESASHSKNKNNVILFLSNAKDILLLFNELYKFNISTDIIHKRHYLALIRNMASFEKADFILYYLEGVRKYPSLLFNFKLFVLFFIRIILNKKC